MKRLGVFLLPLDGMPVHSHSPQFVRFPQQFAGTHLHSWVERGTVRVKCLAQEHSTVSPARARTRTARSGNKRINHLIGHRASTEPRKLQYKVAAKVSFRRLEFVSTKWNTICRKIFPSILLCTVFFFTHLPLQVFFFFFFWGGGGEFPLPPA